MSTDAQDRFTLKYFHDEYVAYKAREIERTQRMKRAELDYLYDSYERVYKDGDYLYDKMMEAIDNGETSFEVFNELESRDIALWADDLIALFRNNEVSRGRCSLSSLLARQLSTEFSFEGETRTVQDRRDDSVYKNVIVRIVWTVGGDDNNGESKK